jgi:hypothetical protein
MHHLEKRLAALEQAPSMADRVTYIIFVGMGEVGMEIVHIYDEHGNTWDRLPSETEEAFKERAASETQRSGGRLPMLFGKVSHFGTT